MNAALLPHVQAYHRLALRGEPVPPALDFANAPPHLVREANAALAKLSTERALFCRDYERKSQHAALTAMLARATASKEIAHAE